MVIAMVSQCARKQRHWHVRSRIAPYLLLSGLHTIMRLALATGEALTCFTELVRRAWQADFMVAAIVIKGDLLKNCWH